jgi:hypothetical protein
MSGVLWKWQKYEWLSLLCTLMSLSLFECWPSVVKKLGYDCTPCQYHDVDQLQLKIGHHLQWEIKLYPKTESKDFPSIQKHHYCACTCFNNCGCCSWGAQYFVFNTKYVFCFALQCLFLTGFTTINVRELHCRYVVKCIQVMVCLFL